MRQKESINESIRVKEQVNEFGANSLAGAALTLITARAADNKPAVRRTISKGSPV